MSGLASRHAIGGGDSEAVPDSSSGPLLPRVCEARSRALRESAGAPADAQALGDLLLATFSGLAGGDLPPLDALSEIYTGDPSVAIVVDGRSGGKSTPALATAFARAFLDMGSAPGSVLIMDATDADLASAGYRIQRTGPGPYCLGTEPGSGYGAPARLRDAPVPIRLSKLAEGTGRRLAVVARLGMGPGGMEPFVLDAALRATDATTRREALRDPSLGARILAGPLFGSRVAMAVGDLVQVRLRSDAEPGSPEAAGRPTAVWDAAEILAGNNLFAVERVGHTILSNTCRARGLREPGPHPILAAAESLGLHGARLSSIDWVKRPA